LNNPAKASPGYVLMPPLHNGLTYLIDNNGQVINTWNSGNSEPGRGAYLMANSHLFRTDSLTGGGVLSLGGGEGGRIREYDWQGNVLWTFQYATATYIMHHDFKQLPNGNIITLVAELKTPADMAAAGFRPNMVQPGGDGDIEPDSVVEIQPIYPNSGNIVWQWHLWDHLVQNYDSTKANYGDPTAHPELVNPNAYYPQLIAAFWNHMNSIDYNADLDQIMLSVRGNSEMWIIDHSTTTSQAAGHTGGKYGKGGDLLYRWGNPQMYSAGKTANQVFFQQHDIQWIAAGLPDAGNVLVFNNGVNRPGGSYSSVDELVLPVDASGNYPLASGLTYGPSQLTSTYTANKQYYVPDMGGAERMPNGDTLICYATLGLLEEVTSAGEVVWQYVNPVVQAGPLTQGQTPALDPTNENMNAVFKVQKYAPDYPGLSGHDLTPKGPIELYAFTVVNGAGMQAGSVASGAIMSLFGTNLADSTATAGATPLPTDLGGATVKIADGAGVTQSCSLFYASAKQINLLVPNGLAAGPATLTIRRDSGSSVWANVIVESVAPGLFSMNASGKGVGAVTGLRVDASGQQSSVPVFSCPAAGQCVAVPIDLGAATDQVYLSLYGTGIRGFSSLSAITVTIGGIAAPVSGAAAQSQYPGLDQVNVGPLPQTLAGTGNSSVVLQVDGRTSNTVTVSLK
jgi:uncharacterized protein (TIGR03437 family)